MAKKQLNSLNDILSKYSVNTENFVFKSTGIECLDNLLGGGLTSNLYAMWGPNGCGKSSLCFQIAKTYCKRGEKVAYIDTELGVSPQQIESFGLKPYVENGTFSLLQCSNYEEYEQIIEALAESDYELTIVDSETMLKAVVGKELKVTDVRPGIKAQQSSFVMNKLNTLYHANNKTAIILFHARANINMNSYGNQPDTKMAGSWTSLHIPSCIIKLTTGAKVKDGDDVIGQIIRITTEKNRFAKPFIVEEKKLIYGIGISKRIDLVDRAIAAGVIISGGSGCYTLPWGDKVRGTKNLYNMSSGDMKRLQDELKAHEVQ